MNRRHFIKLISIFTALFPFLKGKTETVYLGPPHKWPGAKVERTPEEISPNISHALKYDDPYEKINFTYHNHIRLVLDPKHPTMSRIS